MPPVPNAPRRLALSLALLLASCTGFLRAQSTNASLTGRVTDPSKAVIADAKVAAINADTNVYYDGATNGLGEYYLTNLPPGSYRIEIEKTGFQNLIKPNVILHVQDALATDFEMTVGSALESITVEADAPVVNTESAAVSTVVDRTFVENLPLNGRSFQSLLTLAPGTVLTKTSFTEQGQFSVNGQRANANYFMVDGVSADIGIASVNPISVGSGGSLPGLSASGGTNTLVSVDAMQEFKLQTSTYEPEFGRTPGAQVLIVTRSGTNSFHGTLFEYLRNDVLDANDWFANANGLPKPAERQSDFGGVLGGPILRNRTFFFFSYEGLRLRQPQTAITNVPSITSRQTAPSSIQPYLNAFPLPNGADLGNGGAVFAASYSNPTNLNATSLRIDHLVNRNVHLFGRYNYATSQAVQRGGGFSLNSLFPTSANTQTFTAGVTWLIVPTITNEFRANYSRGESGSHFEMDTFGGATPLPDSLLFPSSVSRQDGQYFFSISAFTAGSIIAGQNVSNLQNQVNITDNATVAKGVHQLKVGFDYRRLFPILAPATYVQDTGFTTVGQVLTGQPAIVELIESSGSTSPVFVNISFFAQDTWRVTGRATVTYGLRWEVNPPPSEANGHNPFTLTQVNNPATFSLAPLGRSLWKTTWHNVAPRVGVAYQLVQRPRWQTVVRAGFGVFYDLGSSQAAVGFSSYPYSTTEILPAGTQYPLTAALSAPPTLPDPQTPMFPISGTIVAFDPNLQLPRSYQGTVAVEQSLGPKQSITGTFVTEVGRKLLRQEFLKNTNANFPTVDATQNTATSSYNALQLEFQRRLSAGLQALMSYTWSHSIDDASNDSTLNLPVDPNSDRGPSDFDVRQSFNGAVTYNVPTPRIGLEGRKLLRDWSVDARFTARTPTPVNVVTGTDILQAGLSGSLSLTRPDLIPGAPLYLYGKQYPGGMAFNPKAFDATTPTLEKRQGTLGRNALRGFPVSQLDFALHRQFNFSDRLAFQFRAEFFNILNHPNFGDPGNRLNTATFGLSTQMFGRSLGTGAGGAGLSPLYQVGGPRSGQLALKLLF